MTETREPRTFSKHRRYFADPDVAPAFVVKLRWPDGKPVCPRCGGTEHSFLKTRRIWKCRQPQAVLCQGRHDLPGFRRSASISGSRLIWMVANSKNSVSSHEMARSLGVTQKSVWFMNHRIRLVMQTGTFAKLDGEVEADETFVGGLARNMGKDLHAHKLTGGGGKDKKIVVGTLQRGSDGRLSQVRAAIVRDRNSKTLRAHIERHAEGGSTGYSDEWPAGSVSCRCSS